MRRFDLLRACFWLLAFVIGVEVLVVAFAGASCIWVVVSANPPRIGACENVGELVRNIFSDLLAAILALIVARNGNGSPPAPPPGGGDGPTDGKGGTVAL